MASRTDRACSAAVTAIGASMIAAGGYGLRTIRRELRAQQIIGTPDSPIAGQPVDSGSKARIMATVIEGHVLKGTDGRRYAELASGPDQDQHHRQLWLTATPLITALNLAYFGEMVSLGFVAQGTALVGVGVLRFSS